DGNIAGHEYDGELIGMPIQVETNMLFYRPSVLEDAGLDVPQTLDDLVAVAEQLDDPSGMRAFTSRGRLAAAVTMLAPFLYAHGVNWTADDGTAGFNTAEGVAAFDYYGT